MENGNKTVQTSSQGLKRGHTRWESSGISPRSSPGPLGFPCFVCQLFFASFPSFSREGNQGCSHIPSRIVPAREPRTKMSSKDILGAVTAQNSSWNRENSCWECSGVVLMQNSPLHAQGEGSERCKITTLGP